jgi:hypothetical protein
MDVDFLQIQRRAVDIPAMKEKYGDKIGFDTGIEGTEMGEHPRRTSICKRFGKALTCTERAEVISRG